jgi:hypothetical protein
LSLPHNAETRSSCPTVGFAPGPLADDNMLSRL